MRNLLLFSTAAICYAADDAAGSAPAPAPAEPTGVRARRAFMPKQFIPNADWINVNIVAKGKGTQAKVGRVYGICTGWAEKENTLPNGDKSVSIVLNGVFQTEDYISGEVSQASQAYLPMAYAEKVKTAFVMDSTVKVLELDCDIGLEATGKIIPYEWVVIAYLEGQEMDRLKNIGRSRGRQAVLAASDASAAAQLAAPAAADVIEGQAVEKVVEPAPEPAPAGKAPKA